MGKLVCIVGNSGSGKTTLAKRLGEMGGFQAFLEEHLERPFQAAFLRDKRFGLANQVDYLLYRAEQERAIRQLDDVGVQDGGLDVDFYVFTRLFYRRGYLDAAGYDLCERLYHMLRGLLPPAELIVSLQAPLDVLIERKTARQRQLDVSLVEDLQLMDELLLDWLDRMKDVRVLPIDTRESTPEYQGIQSKILAALSGDGQR